MVAVNWNAKEDAERLRKDPDHLRRKAAYIRGLADTGTAELRKHRLARADELEIEAARLSR